MSFYNAFRNVIETKKYPNARALRTSFWQKISDAFFAFAGSFFEKRNDVNHLGLFDYITLGIPYALWRTLLDTIADDDSLGSIIFLGILNFLFFIVRYITATVLTLISLPIIVIVHGFSLIEGKKLKEKVLQLPINIIQHKPSFVVEVDVEDFDKGCAIKDNLYIVWKNNELHYRAVDFKGKVQKGCIPHSELKTGLGEETYTKFVEVLEARYQNPRLYNWDPKSLDPFLDGVLNILSKKYQTRVESTIGEYLDAEELTLEDFVVKGLVLSEGENKQLKLDFFKGAVIPASSVVGCKDCGGSDGHFHFSYTTSVFNTSPDNTALVTQNDDLKITLEPILKLNVGRITSALEQRDELDPTLRWLKNFSCLNNA